MQLNSGSILLQFSFPRTGGHYLTHVIRGLYDLEPDGPLLVGGIAWNKESTSAARGIHLRGDEEVREREAELNPVSLYALTLRRACGTICPLNLVHGRTGLHGPPGDIRDGERAVVLFRDPIATIYSFYRVWRDRWEPTMPFDYQSVQYHLTEYTHFYDAALACQSEHGDNVKFIRYEDLTASPDCIRDFCDSMDIPTKLDPEFVWHITKFENFTSKTARTFYREGRNRAWMEDTVFCEMLTEVEDFDFSRFGYLRMADYLRAASEMGHFESTRQLAVSVANETKEPGGEVHLTPEA